MPRIWLISLAIACAFGVAFWWMTGEREVAPIADTGPWQASATLPSDGPDGAKLLSMAQREPSGAVTLREEFESSADLFVYAQRASSRARAGDADAHWMLSRVYDYCSGYAANPVAYDSDTRAIAALDVSAAPAMAAARERVSRRCARFTPADGLSAAVVQETRLRAALAGSLAAEAALLADGMPMSDADGYRRGLVERVVASGDPQAFLALSTAMGLSASGEEAELGGVSGTWLSELAWQVAACRLGLDCRAQGNLMTAYCAYGGICSRDPSQDFPTFVRDGGVPRQGAEQLNNMVDSLLSQRRVLK